MSNFPGVQEQAHSLRPMIAMALCLLPAIGGLFYLFGSTLARYVTRQFLTIFFICLAGLFVVWLIAACLIAAVPRYPGGGIRHGHEWDVPGIFLAAAVVTAPLAIVAIAAGAWAARRRPVVALVGISLGLIVLAPAAVLAIALLVRGP